MKVEFDSYHGISGYITVKHEATTIKEDVVEKIGSNWRVPQGIIEEFITAANEMSRYNEVNDIDFVKMIFDCFLSDYEQALFIEQITT